LRGIPDHFPKPEPLPSGIGDTPFDTLRFPIRDERLRIIRINQINGTIPKIYLPIPPSHQLRSPYPCDPHSSFRQAAQLMSVLSKLLKIVVEDTAFSGTKNKQKDIMTRYNHTKM